MVSSEDFKKLNKLYQTEGALLHYEHARREP